MKKAEKDFIELQGLLEKALEQSDSHELAYIKSYEQAKTFSEYLIAEATLRKSLKNYIKYTSLIED
jgi:hypothetical protein